MQEIGSYCQKMGWRYIGHAWVNGRTPDIMTCARCLKTAPEAQFDPPNMASLKPYKPKRSMRWLWRQLPKVP